MVLILFCGLGTAQSQEAAPGADADTQTPLHGTLAFDPSRTRVWVPARLNGTGPFEFLLDTGYDLTMIHPKHAESLELPAAGGVWIIGIAGRERAAYHRGAVFDFEGMRYAPRRVAALPSERERRHPRDGILGSGFFRRFVVVIDPRSGELRLHEPETYQYKGPGEVLPLRFEGDTPVMEAALVQPGGERVGVALEIDTGCEGGLCLGHDFVGANDWVLGTGETRDSFRRGVGGRARTVSGRVGEVRLGMVTVSDLSAEFFKEGTPAGEGRAGHAGWEMFRKFKVIFDYSRSRMIVEEAEKVGAVR